MIMFKASEAEPKNKIAGLFQFVINKFNEMIDKVKKFIFDAKNKSNMKKLEQLARENPNKTIEITTYDYSKVHTEEKKLIKKLKHEKDPEKRKRMIYKFKGAVKSLIIAAPLGIAVPKLIMFINDKHFEYKRNMESLEYLRNSSKERYKEYFAQIHETHYYKDKSENLAKQVAEQSSVLRDMIKCGNDVTSLSMSEANDINKTVVEAIKKLSADAKRVEDKYSK